MTIARYQGADTPVPVPVPVVHTVPDLPGDRDGTFVPDLSAGNRGRSPVPGPVPDLPKSGTRLECCEYPKGVEVYPGPGPVWSHNPINRQAGQLELNLSKAGNGRSNRIDDTCR